MTETQFYWLAYAFFCIVRIPASVKRRHIPLMRGPGYFFNTRVPPDFYQGPGRDILRTYRLWILAPFLFDVAALAAIYSFNRPKFLLLLVMADVVLALVNHTAALKRGIRAAKAFAVEEVPQTSAVAFSLTTRRLRDYTNFSLELTIASFNAGIIQTLYGENWTAWSGALILFYVQVGLLLLKRALIAGRTALPQENAEQYLAWREAFRRMLTDSCDAVRFMTAGIALIAILYFNVTLLAVVTGVVLTGWVTWYWIRLRRFMKLYTSTGPIRLPGALEPEPALPPMLCYRPQTPLSFVKGARGWAINLANRRSQVGVAYLIGLIAVGVLLR
jgi:hypothetical protein